MTPQKLFWFWAGVVVLAIMGGLAWFGLTPFLHESVIDKTSTTVQQIGSPVNTTFNTAKVAAVNITPSSNTATSTSILNSDTSDRIITDAFVTCSNVGNVFAQTAAGLASAGWNWQAATTAAATPATLGANANLAMNVIVATTSAADAYTASTTYTQVFNRRWGTGTYMTFWENATSSSAVCQAGVHYLAQ